MTVYENTEHGFSIEYPEGWSRMENTLGRSFEIEFTDPERRLTMGIYMEHRLKEITLADAVSERRKYLGFQPLLERISQGDTTIGEGIPAYEIVLRRSTGAKVEELRNILFVRQKQNFSLGVIGAPDNLEQWQESVGSMLSSFILLPTYTFVSATSYPGGTYTDTLYGFSISYPLGWFQVPTGRPGQIISLTYSEEASPGITISVVPVVEGTTLTEYVPQVSQGLSQDWSDFDLVSQGETVLSDGTSAYEILFSGVDEGRSLKCKYLIVIQGTEAFFIMGFTSPDRFEQDEAAMDKVLYSFHLE